MQGLIGGATYVQLTTTLASILLLVGLIGLCACRQKSKKKKETEDIELTEVTNGETKKAPKKNHKAKVEANRKNGPLSPANMNGISKVTSDNQNQMPDRALPEIPITNALRTDEEDAEGNNSESPYDVAQPPDTRPNPPDILGHDYDTVTGPHGGGSGSVSVDPFYSRIRDEQQGGDGGRQEEQEAEEAGSGCNGSNDDVRSAACNVHESTTASDTTAADTTAANATAVNQYAVVIPKAERVSPPATTDRQQQQQQQQLQPPSVPEKHLDVDSDLMAAMATALPGGSPSLPPRNPHGLVLDPLSSESAEPQAPSTQRKEPPYSSVSARESLENMRQRRAQRLAEADPNDLVDPSDLSDAYDSVDYARIRSPREMAPRNVSDRASYTSGLYAEIPATVDDETPEPGYSCIGRERRPWSIASDLRSPRSPSPPTTDVTTTTGGTSSTSGTTATGATAAPLYAVVNKNKKLRRRRDTDSTVYDNCCSGPANGPANAMLSDVGRLPTDSLGRRRALLAAKRAFLSDNGYETIDYDDEERVRPPVREPIYQEITEGRQSDRRSDSWTDSHAGARMMDPWGDRVRGIVRGLESHSSGAEVTMSDGRGDRQTKSSLESSNTQEMNGDVENTFL